MVNAFSLAMAVEKVALCYCMEESGGMKDGGFEEEIQ